MPIYLTNAGLVFSNSTTQTTKASVLGPVQLGPNQGVTIAGGPVQEITTGGYYINNPTGSVQANSNSVVHCGWNIYRYSTGGASYVRQVYRTVT
jgi:hypothetical protein